MKKSNAHLPSPVAVGTVQVAYNGPLPPSSEMRSYNEIDPSLPLRIMNMAENEQQHRHKVDAYNHEIELKKIETALSVSKNNELKLRLDARNTLIGMMFAFLISLFVIASSVFCICYGQVVLGSVLGVGGLGAIVYVFVYGSHIRPDEPPRTTDNSRVE